MTELPIKELLRILQADCTGNIDGIFTGVSINSRTAKEGDCFFAIEGENFNGHDYIEQSFEKGAVCAVVSKDIAGDNIIKVNDTVKALGQLAAAYRKQMGFKVVAITGSVGKTTTREIIYHILSSRFNVHQAPKNFNNHIGLPLTLLSADSDTEVIIAEIGGSGPGEISYLTEIAAPDIALVTNVYPAHLEGFGDLQTVTNEKLSISQGLTDGQPLIINGDFQLLAQTCKERNLKFISFGRSPNCDIRFDKVNCNGSSGSFGIDGVKVHLPLAGYGNVENAVAAWAVCSKFAISADTFAAAIKNFTGVSMRTEIIDTGRLTIINDCYNANPASMKNALEILSGLAENKQRTVFICGDMAELGRHTGQFHKELGAEIAKANVDVVLAVGHFSAIAVETAKKIAEYDLQINCFENAICACNNLDKYIKDDDIILVKGSRSIGLERVVEKLRRIFGEKK